MNEPEAVTAARHLLGARLAQLRRAEGLRQRDLSARISYGRSSVANVECGAQRVPRLFWMRCDEVLASGGVLVEGYDRIELLRREKARTVAGYGAFSPSSPGAGPPCAADAGPVLVLHWTRMLQVLAASQNLLGPRQIHDAVVQEMAVIGRYGTEAAGDVKTGLLGVQARWAEFASWTADNVGDRAGAVSWLRQALVSARRAGDRTVAAYVLMRQAQQAADRRDGATATALADAAARSGPLTDRDRALCAIRQGQGHALRGDREGCRTALTAAYRFVARAGDGSDEEDPATIGVHCVRPYVQVHEGYCLLRLGQTTAAISLLEGALTGWPGSYRQDEGLARAWLALAYAAGNRLAEAGAQGSRALQVTTTTAWSARTLRALGQLDTRLAGSAAPVEVAQFRTSYAGATAAYTMRA